jgi:hypothetical protein
MFWKRNKEWTFTIILSKIIIFEDDFFKESIKIKTIEIWHQMARL